MLKARAFPLIFLAGCAGHPAFEAARPSMEAECKHMLTEASGTACRVKVFNRFYGHSTPAWMRQLQTANIELAKQVDAGLITRNQMDQQMRRLWQLSRHNRSFGAARNVQRHVIPPVHCRGYTSGGHSQLTCR